MIKEKVVVASKSGLHARPANILMANAKKFASTVEIGVNDKTYNAKSILTVLAAGVNMGQEIEVICNGEDEAEALATIVTLVSHEME